MHDSCKLSWVVFSIGCNELTNLILDILSENASFLFQLKLIVIVASYSFINLLHQNIIFCPWANSFSQFSQFGSDQLHFCLNCGFFFFLFFLENLVE